MRIRWLGPVLSFHRYLNCWILDLGPIQVSCWW